MERNKGYRWQVMVAGPSLFCFILLTTTALWAQENATPDPKSGSPKEIVNAQGPAQSTVVEGQLSVDNILDEPLEAPVKKEVSTASTEDEQFVRINKSLKNLIDENQKLVQQKDKLEKDIEALRGERMVQETRLRALARERLSTLKKSEIIDSVTANYEQEIQDLKKKLEEATQNKPVEATPITDQAKVPAETPQAVPAGDQTETPQAPQQPTAAPIAVMRGASEMASEMGKLVEENQILRKDTIKLHYNLANLFFEQGRYDLSSAEYKRVLDLMPQDAATHYNLAFVSEEYLKDYPTAIEHYKKYLALEPAADDAGFVKNQILQLQLKIQNKIDSYIDKEDGQTDLPLK